MKRSPWFNARTHPPVNGGPYAEYEHRCWYLSKNGVWRLPKFRIVGHGRDCRGRIKYWLAQRRKEIKVVGEAS